MSSMKASKFTRIIVGLLTCRLTIAEVIAVVLAWHIVSSWWPTDKFNYEIVEYNGTECHRLSKGSKLVLITETDSTVNVAASYITDQAYVLSPKFRGKPASEAYAEYRKAKAAGPLTVEQIRRIFEPMYGY